VICIGNGKKSRYRLRGGRKGGPRLRDSESWSVEQNMSKKFFIRVSLLILGVSVVGCATTGGGFDLTVSNNSDAKVKEVEVVLDGRLAYRVDQLKPREIMVDPISVRASGPRESLVRWRTEKGETVEKRFAPEKPLPRNFKGKLDMEFRSAVEVVMYSDLMENREGSLIPWARPEDWEGAPTIPGLSTQ